MKAYELKALLSSLDDGAEVSIELENPYVYRISGNIKALIPCGAAPRTARLQVTASDLGVIPNAQERIEELEQQLDELKREVRSAFGALGDMNAFREGCEIAKVLEELEELL